MKFQCGECDKYFTINNIQVADKDLDFQCDTCGNQFFINRNLSFSSSSKNSSMLCGNCGTLIPENNSVCDSCNLILNKSHEELRIDNKYYETLEIKNDGQVYNTNSGRKLSKRGMLIPGIVVAIILPVISAWYYTRNKTNEIMPTGTRIETQVVIMKSGQTYYADTIEKDGTYIEITSKNGVISKVLEKNVLQISKAIIED